MNAMTKLKLQEVINECVFEDNGPSSYDYTLASSILNLYALAEANELLLAEQEERITTMEQRITALEARLKELFDDTDVDG